MEHTHCDSVRCVFRIQAGRSKRTTWRNSVGAKSAVMKWEKRPWLSYLVILSPGESRWSCPGWYLLFQPQCLRKVNQANHNVTVFLTFRIMTQVLKEGLTFHLEISATQKSTRRRQNRVNTLTAMLHCFLCHPVWWTMGTLGYMWLRNWGFSFCLILISF